VEGQRTFHQALGIVQRATKNSAAGQIRDMGTVARARFLKDNDVPGA
jgi:hypothetical protein